ncbi:apolipoprotein N-acyltransferase [Streptomyces sp. WAC 01529]|uniref:apolipoprotein N-acyltransferase n=1 Tax=Streptomyces sp. WAC 01529 TaxID=2203205 RepID=UPI000F6D1DEF|nr:apolipoprotein N-acyltransferase [Streptomyces sp. WAC 01529]AZM52003.1 apolipoprotein N-acyltransferase [Streptomyces sp. WAC 01529]
MDLFGDDRRQRPGHPAERLLTSRWSRGGIAVLAGALPALAFPAPSLWWFAYVALVPWILLVRTAATGRRAMLDGWLGGLGFMVAVHHWLLPSLHVFTVVIAALLGLLWAPWGRLVRRFLTGVPTPGRAAAALVVLPSGWLLVELIRSWEGLGGPWGLLGSSQWQLPPALRLASVGGVWLVSALVVAVNTGVALLVVAWAARGRAPAAGYIPGPTSLSGPEGSATPGDPATPRGPAAPALVGLLTVVAMAVAAWSLAPRPETAGHTRVAVVQPGVIDGIAGAEKRLARQETLTRSLAGRDLDLVVWGESSVGFDLAERPDVARRIAALSREVGADILVNVDARRSDRPGIYKSSVLVGPDGPTGDRYDKMRLVPFGEYIPARSLLGWATSVGKAAGEDRRRGDRQVVMDAGHGLRVGPLVCFESAFPDMSRQLTRDGARLLLAQSATSSFQSSWAPEQHASLAALRAAETGRPMVHATLTGVSAVHAPDGSRVGAALGTSASTAEVYDVPLGEGTTAYVRWGDWPLYGALLVLAALCAAEGARVLKRRGHLGRPDRRGPLSRPASERRGPRARTAHGSPVRPGR